MRKLKSRKGAGGIHMRHTGSGEGGGGWGGFTMEWLNMDVFIMDWRCGKRCLNNEGRL